MSEPWTLGPVVITGGTGLVGLDIAKAFLEAGATTVAVGSSAERGAAAAKELASFGDRAKVRAADMTKPEAVKALFDEVESTLGTVAVLVNGAGINFNRMIRDVTSEEFDRVMAVNVKAMFFSGREACERMAAMGIAGRMVNISSGNYRYARPDAALYSASKAAVDMLTRGFALEYGQHGIAINAVAPGLVDRHSTDPQYLKVRDYYKKNSSQQALITPQDVANAVMYLASERAALIAGETIVIDGGFSAGRLDFPRRSS